MTCYRQIINSIRVISILLAFNVTYGNSKGIEIDSLKKILTKHKDDTAGIMLMGKLSKLYYKASMNDSAIVYAKKTIILCEQQDFIKGEILPYLVLGNITSDKADYSNGLYYYNEAKRIADSLKDYPDLAGAYNNIGIIFYMQGNYSRANEFYYKALQIAEKLNLKEKVFLGYVNLGIVYQKTDNFQDALKYLLSAKKLGIASGNKIYMASVYENLGSLYNAMNNYANAINSEDSALYFAGIEKKFQMTGNCYDDLGEIYFHLRKYDSALGYYKSSLEIRKHLGDWAGAAVEYGNIGKIYVIVKKTSDAKKYLDTALTLSRKINDKQNLKDIYANYTSLDSAAGNYSAVLMHYKLYNVYKDSLTNEDNIRLIETEKTNYEIEKMEQQDKERHDVEKLEQEKKIARQKFAKNVFIGGFSFAFIFAGIFFMQRKRIAKERDRSDKLLLNILPAETAEELKTTGESKARNYQLVTVMFTDFKNFTRHSENMTAEELVKEINYCYKEFDKINARHNVEKIKTMGDGYMAAGGVPIGNLTNPVDTVAAALEIQQFMENMKAAREKESRAYFEVRIGIHTGPVVAGIVGLNKFAYDIWGDTVNIAARMESSGEAGKVNVSGATYELIKDKYNCIYRGKVHAKNKGEIDMYFVEG